MSYWIKWIGSIVGTIIGTGLIGEVIMYFIKRHDERIEKENRIIEKVICGLSQYSERLNTGLRIWNSNFNILINEFKDYIKNRDEAEDNLEFLEREYKEVVDDKRKYICKYAKICPRRLNSESSETLLEYSEKSNIILSEFTEKQNNLKEMILKLLDDIQSVIYEFNDLTNHFSDVYTLKGSRRRKIIVQLEKMQQVNSAISGCIIDIKSDPIARICDEKYSIARLLIIAINGVADGKTKISQTMD